jgi:hypothetical protein
MPLPRLFKASVDDIKKLVVQLVGRVGKGNAYVLLSSQQECVVRTFFM